MNYGTIAFGCIPTLFALFTLVLRFRKPQLFAKLAPMQQRLGQRAGFIVHTVVYSLVPLAFGLTFIHAGINGQSMAQLMAG